MQILKLVRKPYFLNNFLTQYNSNVNIFKKNLIFFVKNPSTRCYDNIVFLAKKIRKFLRKWQKRDDLVVGTVVILKSVLKMRT